MTKPPRVLFSIGGDGGVRMRDIAETVGITERAAQRIVADLIQAGYVTRKRVGRRNRYVVDPKVRMRHASQQEQEIGDLLDLLGSDPSA